MFRYAYTDTLNLTSVEDAMLTAYAAKKYLLPHLLRECFVFIEAHVSPKNVCQVYEFAAVLEAHHLIYECLNIIDRQTHHVLTCSTFPSISVSTLETIVGRPYLNIYSEFSLYSAVHLWAEEECKRRNVEIEMENLRIVLDSVLPHVRFLAMTAEEFCKGPAKNGLLSKDECYAIFMNLAIPGIVPMPKGLSSDMTKRTVPPDFFIASRFSPTGFHSPVRPVRVCGIRFTVTNHDIFLVGVGFPVRLDTNYFSVRQPKFEGSLRFLYKIQEDKIEREDMSVSFSLARDKDVRLRLRKTYYVRKGIECELELHVNSMLAEDVVIPNMRNRKKEDTVDGITFHFHQFSRGQASNAAELMEFSEIYYYF